VKDQPLRPQEQLTIIEEVKNEDGSSIVAVKQRENYKAETSNMTLGEQERGRNEKLESSKTLNLQRGFVPESESE
jgi:hypothetical protein